jgi:hypothetical protein
MRKREEKMMKNVDDDHGWRWRRGWWNRRILHKFNRNEREE